MKKPISDLKIGYFIGIHIVYTGWNPLNSSIPAKIKDFMKLQKVLNVYELFGLKEYIYI